MQKYIQMLLLIKNTYKENNSDIHLQKVYLHF